jgi:hypothetical protein
MNPSSLIPNPRIPYPDPEPLILAPGGAAYKRKGRQRFNAPALSGL